MRRTILVVLLLAMAGCGWKGSPVVDDGELLRTCERNCPEGECVKSSGRWACETKEDVR